MAEAVAVVRAKKQAEANSEREAVLTRSESLLDEKFDAYEAANYRMWARSKSEAFSRRKPSGTRSHKNHNLDLLNSYGFAPQNAELMTRVKESSSFNQGHGSNGFFRGYCEEGGAAERMAEEGRLGGEGLKTKGARDSSGNSGSSASSYESAAEDERGLRGFLRHCRKKDRRASAPDQGCADGAEGGEGKATAPGAALLKRSLTGDTEGKTMSTMDTTADKAMERGALNGVTESMTGRTLLRSASDTLQDAEMDEMDREVLQEAFSRVVGLQQRVQHYRDLGGFVVLMALFITILYLQADSSRSYEITAAHAVLFPPGVRQDASNTFNGPDYFYSWLNTSIMQSLWADLTCGDGTCHRPFQFPAFGRFGCEADCGKFPNLTSVVVRFSSHLDTQLAVDGSSWNLCMVDPVSLCWYETFQPFPRGETETTVALDIPDGDWVVVLNAPAGGIRGTVHAPPPGTRRFSVVGAASTIELAAWGYCALDDGTVAANQTGPSGGAAGASPDICRDTCEKLVVCLPATCGRAFTECSWTVRACASSHLLPSPPMPTLPAPAGYRIAIFQHPVQCLSQRLTVLQVAVSRALFTVAKDRCLAGHGPGASRKHSQGGPGSLRWHMVACFCTMLGGPVMTMDECRLTDTEGQQVLSISDMHAYLQSTHVRGGRVISAQHMRRFVLTVGAALSSVTLISDAAAACLNSLMHSFDDAIVTSDAVGCSQGGCSWPVVLLVGACSCVTHNTTIHVGDKVTWVWDDDLPHSLKEMDDESPGFFSYSKVFEEPITIHYEDGTLSVDDSSSSSASSPSSASLLTVLPARAGAEVADVANATDSSTLSSTARFTDTNTTTPSATSAPYQCSPGCRLRRLANGVCDAACNTPACAFDGGDCACVDPLFGPGICACPPAHTRHDDGSCCLSTAVGANLNFPFSLQRYGPSYTESNFASAAERGFPVKRYVSRRNRFRLPIIALAPGVTTTINIQPSSAISLCQPPSPLPHFPWQSANRHGAAAGSVGHKAVQWIGLLFISSFPTAALHHLLFHPTNSASSLSSLPSLLHLAGWCSNGTSLEPFGVNPHFLPTSAIYDSAASANMSQLDNNTFGVKLKFNPQGLPYGFIYPIASLTTLPLVFDINLDYEAAMRRLLYLVDGGYIDNGTRTVDVSFITYNGSSLYFSAPSASLYVSCVHHLHTTLTGETLTFVLTTVRCTLNAGGSMAVTFRSQPAAMAMYDASADNIARLVLEVVYLVGLLWNVCGELQEMADRAAVDVLSLALLLWASMELAFDMQPRYDIYYTLLEMPRYWAVPNPPTGFISATQAFAELRNIINLRGIYFALQGINLFFMMIRLLKVMDFQPYLGVITRSLALATPSLLHFFLLSFAVFFCFSMYGYLVFGGALEMFSTVLESMFSCFLLLLNDNSSAYFFQRLESWDLIAAMLFFFMVFILLNFLIAIIVDAFMSVKDSNIVATSITSDLGHIIKYKWNCWRGRYLRYPVILDRLVHLGAKDTRVEESNRRMRRMQSLKRHTREIFSGSCGGDCRPSHSGRGNNQPAAFPPDSESRVRRQHVLTVREKRIDAISLAMILQRRHDRERGEPHTAELLPKCWSSASANEGVDEEQLEQLSQAVVLQCGEVVKQAALPVKKPVQKLSLAHIKVGKEGGDRCREQEDLACSRAEVKELRSMMADMQALMLDLLARTPPTGSAAHAMGDPAGPSTAPSMRRAHTEPAPLCALLTDSPQPLEQAVSRRDMPRGLSDSGASGGAVEGVERAGGVQGGLGIAGGSASRSLLASKQGSERRVLFKESTAANRKSPLRTGGEWQQEPLV
ncbi:unnamed protein product [Closterium sp. NIES-65]|nr:unnamed protein product [Closterium sp. NIES-65]